MSVLATLAPAALSPRRPPPIPSACDVFLRRFPSSAAFGACFPEKPSPVAPHHYHPRLGLRFCSLAPSRLILLFLNQTLSFQQTVNSPQPETVWLSYPALRVPCPVPSRHPVNICGVNAYVNERSCNVICWPMDGKKGPPGLTGFLLGEMCPLGAKGTLICILPSVSP